jgi:DNA (cytosine-5)-methyltransferase 1
MRFVDLFAGLGGFHLALEAAGGECVYAIELDDELRELYHRNHGVPQRRLGADIRNDWKRVPGHDVLCAGFPCQPFSKSGAQLGKRDLTRGTLFEFVLKIARERQPRLILLENVGNFERHDSGNTWSVVRESLCRAGYDVVGTEHKNAGGPGLISPHHHGYPQVRERFFAVAALGGFSKHPLVPNGPAVTPRATLSSIIQCPNELSATDNAECALSESQMACVDHWNEFIQSVPASLALPGFPIWSDEFEARYPVDQFLGAHSTPALRRFSTGVGADLLQTREEVLMTFPSYMRNGNGSLPAWKTRFIEQNREFYQNIRRHLRRGWVDELQRFPASLRKLEWNCHGEERDLWRYVLQFRPSGLRAKRFTSTPALVAMTTTQIPILGPQRRFLTRVEGKRLQAMPDSLALPIRRADAFKALGNAVHVGVVQSVYEQALAALPTKTLRPRRASVRRPSQRR